MPAVTKYSQRLQPVIEMNSDQGKWTLTRLFAPLKQGYIEANATLDFNQVSKPWSVDISADGLPISPMLQQLDLPLDATGYGELNCKLLAYMAIHPCWAIQPQANLKAAFVSVMTFNDTLSGTSTDNAGLKSPELNASFDRGRFTLQPMHIIGAICRVKLFTESSNFEWRSFWRARPTQSRATPSLNYAVRPMQPSLW
ncbi:AsmA family protein [Vibrio chagasii]|nr:AsmA family protein [Vibrio chagasii]